MMSMIAQKRNDNLRNEDILRVWMAMADLLEHV